MAMADIIAMPTQFDARQIEIMRQTVAKDVPSAEFSVFLEVCKHRQLNPFNREIYAIMRGSGSNRQMTIQVSIDGFRLLAERSGKYRGQRGPFFCGEDGVWKEEWLSNKPPVLAKVGILRADFDGVIWAIARYNSYVQLRDGAPTTMWAKMPDILLAKCAEALAIRKTFPLQVAGLYVHEEMMQADNAPNAGRLRSPVPTMRSLCIQGQDANLWQNPEEFYQFCSDFLERPVNRENGKTVTMEERQRLDLAIADLIGAGFADKAITVDSAPVDDGVSIDELNRELQEQQSAERVSASRRSHI